MSSENDTSLLGNSDRLKVSNRIGLITSSQAILLSHKILVFLISRQKNELFQFSVPCQNFDQFED
jgi:hypothetical protein